MRILIKILVTLVTIAVSGYSYSQCSAPTPMLCDIVVDRQVNELDIEELIRLKGTQVEPGDLRDIDRDGEITVLDARKCAVICKNTICAITLNQPPLADAGPDQTVATLDEVTLDGTGSSDADGDPLTFLWSLSSRPPGSAAVLANAITVNPSITVDVPGNYEVQLIVSDGVDISLADTIMISTTNSAPVADAGDDQSPLVGQTATLDGSASTDVDGDLLQYAWLLTSRPSASNAALSDPGAVMPTFDIDAPGSYEAQLIVNDGTVDSAPDTVVVTTANSPPVAHAGADQSVFVNEAVTLDASGSVDVDGDALTYQWALTVRPGGSAAVLSNQVDVSPTFTADVPGTYVAQVIVYDGTIYSAADTVTITTENRAPVADAGPVQAIFVNDVVQLDGVGSSDADGDTLTYAWSFNSRPSGSNAVLSNPSVAGPTFTVDRPGDYVAQLIVNDGIADSAPDTLTLTTTNRRPTACITPVPTANRGDSISFVSCSTDVDGDPLTYQWSLSGAPAANSASLTNTNQSTAGLIPNAAGTYVIQLIVSDSVLQSTPVTTQVTVTGDLYALSTTTYSAIAGTGWTNVTLADDAVSGAIPLGFSFSFFGTSYSTGVISSNGFFTFTASGSGCCSGQVLPDANTPNNLIALVWDDLYPPGGGTVRYKTIGTAPNRSYILQYNGIQHYSARVPSVTTQMRIYEGSNCIEIHTSQALSAGVRRTMGIENASGTIGYFVPGRNGQVFTISTPEARRFCPLP
jgi:PKD domain